MRKLLLYTFGVALLSLLANVIIGAPSRRWSTIRPGMNAEQITSSLGAPDNDLIQSKSIQILTNGGFIRFSTLAVLYYDQNTPESATRVMQSDTWIWERL